MKGYFARLGSLGFIEIVGMKLLQLQNYMQYRAIIYICMVSAVLIYIFAETCLESTKIDCFTDYEISKNETTPTLEDLDECLQELEEKLKGKENE